MLKEQKNIDFSCPNDPPGGLGVTLVVLSVENAPEIALKLIRSAWSVVSSWGRWCDEGLGEWPQQEDCLKSLPDWLQTALNNAPRGDVENWFDDLHDRQWIWWSSAKIGAFIKIDLDTDSMPSSFWTLEFVINSVGGKVIYKNMWIDVSEVEKLLKKKNEVST